MIKAIERIYPGILPIQGRDAETRAAATLQRIEAESLARTYESLSVNWAKLLFIWLRRRGADDEALERCGFI
jgi:hypothetical protein